MNFALILVLLAGASVYSSAAATADQNKLRICHLDQAAGPCKAAVSKWFYDPYRALCAEFTYGGCQGNENNFASQQECENFCRDVPPCPMASVAPPEGCAKYHVVFEATEAAGFCPMPRVICDDKVSNDSLRICRLTREIAPCSKRPLVENWYYDPHSAVCRNFSYGGCQTNENNFATLAACEQKCKLVPPCPMFSVYVPEGCHVVTEQGDNYCPTPRVICAEKEGSCPRVRRGTVGICVEGCQNDSSCPGAQKCCSNGCGHTCTDPAGETSGVCQNVTCGPCQKCVPQRKVCRTRGPCPQYACKNQCEACTVCSRNRCVPSNSRACRATTASPAH